MGKPFDRFPEDVTHRTTRTYTVACAQQSVTVELQRHLSARPRRILVKRPRKGPYLGGRRPDFSYEGKAVRIDVLLAPGK